MKGTECWFSLFIFIYILSVINWVLRRFTAPFRCSYTYAYMYT